MRIRVDSLIRSLAYIYASDTTATVAGDGSFSILVFRLSRVTPPTTPDTATVELKTYETPEPKAGDIPTARAAVLMHFAGLGKTVTPTIVDLRFEPYNR